MFLRDNNFVSEIKGIEVIEESIKNLEVGQKYYFTVNIKNNTSVFYVEKQGEAEKETFLFFKDNQKYTFKGVPYTIIIDEATGSEDTLIKVITNNLEDIALYRVASKAEPSNIAMANYIKTYIDAMQTI